MLQHLTHNRRAFRQKPRNRYLKGFISAPKLNGPSRYSASFCFILLFFKHFWVQHFTALPYHSFQYSSVLPVREWRPVSGQETSIWSTLEIVASLSNMALYLRKEQFSRTTQYNGLLDQLKLKQQHHHKASFHAYKAPHIISCCYSPSVLRPSKTPMYPQHLHPTAKGESHS